MEPNTPFLPSPEREKEVRIPLRGVTIGDRLPPESCLAPAGIFFLGVTAQALARRIRTVGVLNAGGASIPTQTLESPWTSSGEWVTLLRRSPLRISTATSQGAQIENDPSSNVASWH